MSNDNNRPSLPGWCDLERPARPRAYVLRMAAEQFADHDDCLQAAVDFLVRSDARYAGRDLRPRWEDERTRETILVDVPPAVAADIEGHPGHFEALPTRLAWDAPWPGPQAGGAT